MAENRYGAECCRCGQWVNPNDGYLLGKKVTHKKCVPVADVDRAALRENINERYDNTLRNLKD